MIYCPYISVYEGRTVIGIGIAMIHFIIIPLFCNSTSILRLWRCSPIFGAPYREPNLRNSRPGQPFQRLSPYTFLFGVIFTPLKKWKGENLRHWAKPLEPDRASGIRIRLSHKFIPLSPAKCNGDGLHNFWDSLIFGGWFQSENTIESGKS